MSIKQKIRMTRCGDTLHIYEDSTADQAEKQIEKNMIENGVSVHRAGGIRQFYRDDPIIDTTKTGADQYTWNKNGERVKHKRFLITVHPDGLIEKEFIKYIWKII